MISLTYGVMPDRSMFNIAFAYECPDGSYKINLNSNDAKVVDEFALSSGRWTCEALWFALREINDTDPSQFQNDEMMERAMDVVSAILYTLGFEWI